MEVSLPTFAEGPGDEFKDGLGKFHEPESASFGAATHNGKGEADSSVSTQKGWHPPRVPLDLGACLGEPCEMNAPQKPVSGKSTAASAASPALHPESLQGKPSLPLHPLLLSTQVLTTGAPRDARAGTALPGYLELGED